MTSNRQAALLMLHSAIIIIAAAQRGEAVSLNKGSELVGVINSEYGRNIHCGLGARGKNT